jgi:hypothetical protein
MAARKIDTYNVVDTSWVKQSFMMSSGSIDAQTALYRTLTSAAYKFADTSPGGNAAINPPPQFTRYADIKFGGDGQKAGTREPAGSFRPSSSNGMGRYYSEAIDDNAVHAFMRFGVPAYNSLTNFFSNFYNDEASSMARTGRGTSVFFKAGYAVGFIVGIVPRALVFMGNVLSWFSGQPASKYYYLKPAMPLYWNAVTTIVNTIAVNMGVIPPLVGTDPSKINDGGDWDKAPSGYTSADINAAMHAMQGDIFDEKGGIDVYSLATRYQRLYMSEREAGYNALSGLSDSQGGAEGFAALKKALGSFFQQPITDSNGTNWATTAAAAVGTAAVPGTSTGLTAYLAAYMACVNQTGTPDSSTQTAASPAATNTSTDANSTGSPSDGGDTNPPVVAPSSGSDSSGETILKPGSSGGTAFDSSWWQQFGQFLNAELHDGGAFVSFRIDGSGTIGESFSTATKQSDIQSKINSMSSSNRDTRFTYEGGNLGGGLIGGLVTSAISAATDLVKGYGASLGVSGLSALAGSAFVDIPEMWDSSTANLPRADFTLQLRSPYGNKMSRLLNLYIPMAMVLAGALPLSTGKQSYTSPFLCEIYVRGRITCRLGIIDSLNITRGAGNIGWTEDSEPLGIDVSFSVKDLSSVMFMPISASYSFGQGVATAAVAGAASVLQASSGATNIALGAVVSTFNSTWDDDNAYTDYMAVLGSLTMVDQVSQYRKWKLRMTRQIAQYNSWKSPGHAASWLHGTWPARLISGFLPAARLGQGPGS